MCRFTIITGMICALAASTAFAELAYLASDNTTILRISEAGSVESFTFNKYFHAMHRDLASGEIYALGNNGGGTPPTVFKVNNAESGTMTLTAFSALSQQYGAFTQMGDTFCGIHGDALWSIDLSDPLSPIETELGPTGVTGIGGSAYNPIDDELYVLSYDTNGLYTVNQTTGQATIVGYTGVNLLGCGAEWFDGLLYAGLENLATGMYEIGTLDAGTGAFTAILTVDENVGVNGMTVIPEPTALAFMLTGFAMAVRRR